MGFVGREVKDGWDSNFKGKSVKLMHGYHVLEIILESVMGWEF